MYGTVPEKTIWFYYNKGFSPMPSKIVDLCIQSFCKNNPDWNIEYVDDNNLLQYVHRKSLPTKFFDLPVPANKKDIAMGALLAMYGGVAADSTMINLKSLTYWWDQMLLEGKDAFFYWYRLTEQWGRGDSVAAYFIMARRDTGIFRRYTQDIIMRLGDGIYPSAIPGDPYIAYAGNSIEPIVLEINSSLPVCSEQKEEDIDDPKLCTKPREYHVANNSELNNVKIMLLDPRDPDVGTQFGQAWIALGMKGASDGTWTPRPNPDSPDSDGALWREYQHRLGYENFRMIKLFGGGGEWAKKHPSQLIMPVGTPAEEDNILSMWFKDAGLDPSNHQACKKLPESHGKRNQLLPVIIICSVVLLLACGAGVWLYNRKKQMQLPADGPSTELIGEAA